jgi:tetratricopeptide (TPR) repeat protein/tRNA A-37 threonylcarbamoyl transferase component Bud32
MGDRPTSLAAINRSSIGSLERGAPIGPYVVLDVIGRGGMGVVYAAYDPRLDRRVAIKILHAHVAFSEASIEAHDRLLREAQAMARVTHANVVAIHHVGTFEGEVFLAMEFVEGDTLKTWLRTPRSQTQVLDVLLAAGRGLAAAHAAGIIHRDFKPDNVLVGRDGRVAVSDFGISRPTTESDEHASFAPVSAARSTSSSDADEPEGTSETWPSSSHRRTLTRPGAIVGTVGYMAPEQAFSEPVDARCDQFSFCATLYFALHGERPFRGATLKDYLAALEREAPTPAGSNVAPRVGEILQKGLSYEPDARYPSMDALLAALSDDPATRKRRVAAWGVAIAIGLAGTVTVVGASRARDQRLCAGGLAQVRDVWNTTTRAQVRRAFEATKLPYATTTWEHVQRALDAYAARWASAQYETCAAARIRGEQSESVMTARAACLERGRTELRALVRVLGEADRSVVGKAVQATAVLGSPEACVEIVSTSTSPAPPDDARARGEVGEIRIELATAKALRASGRLEAAAGQIDALLLRAHAIAYRPLEAELLLAQGKVLQDLGQWALSIPALENAVGTADEAVSDADRAFAEVALANSYAMTGQHDAAEQWSRFARATSTRLTQDSSKVAFELDWNLTVSNHRFNQSRYAEAAAYAEKALEGVQSRSADTDPIRVAHAYTMLAVSYAETGRIDQAVVMIDRADAMVRSAVGPEHPSDVLVRLRRAYVLLVAKRFQDVVDMAGPAIELAQRVLPPDHSYLGTLYNNRGGAFEGLHRFDDALCDFDRASAIDAPSPQIDGAMYMANRCRMLLYLERFDDAEKVCGDGLRAGESLLAPDHEWLALLLGLSASVDVHEGRAREALPKARRALQIFATKTNMAVDDDWIAIARFAFARASWETGARAPDTLEAARDAQWAFARKGLSERAAEVKAWLTPRAVTK